MRQANGEIRSEPNVALHEFHELQACDFRATSIDALARIFASDVL
jgi:hypothetical protein